MSPKLAEYVEAGYALTPDERLEAARLLRLSADQDTDGDQAQIDAAWDETIVPRVSEVVDGPESLAEIRAELAARHK